MLNVCRNLERAFLDVDFIGWSPTQWRPILRDMEGYGGGLFGRTLVAWATKSFQGILSIKPGS